MLILVDLYLGAFVLKENTKSIMQHVPNVISSVKLAIMIKNVPVVQMIMLFLSIILAYVLKVVG